MLKKIFMLLLAVVLGVFACGCRDSPSGENETNTPPGTDAPDDTDFEHKVRFTQRNISATDALGRFYDAAGELDESKQVGIFYFLWSGSAAADFDLSKMDLERIKANTDIGAFHYWSEPLYGYYHSADPWVFRKHLELFMNAGIDYIFFDVTNAILYENVLDSILPVALELQQAGYPVPKLAFYCNAKTKETVTALYNGYYKPGTENGDKYKSLWYRFADTNNANAQGKPWIAARRSGLGDKEPNFADCSAEIKEFFYLKDAQWPNEGANFDNGMPWMSWADGEQYNHNGIMSVSVAQHTSGAFSDAVLENNRNRGRGRGWSSERGNDAAAVDSGANFAGQWQNAISAGNAVNNVFVTGWNEWIAQKQPKGQGRSSAYFVDLFNKEFSRDTEMMKGGYGDNFYLQTAQNIRRFKAKAGVAPDEFTVRRIDLSGDSAQWNATACYVDMAGDTAARNYRSANTTLKEPYTVPESPNDIKSIRVAHDDEYVYFRIECADKITAPEANVRNWMNLFIEVDGATGDNWNGYRFVVNRTVIGNSTYVERLKADGSSSAEASATLKLSGRTLTVKISRRDIVATGASVLRFKVADNVAETANIMDYYVHGDCAPLGRLSYTYRIK